MFNLIGAWKGAKEMRVPRILNHNGERNLEIPPGFHEHILDFVKDPKDGLDQNDECHTCSGWWQLKHFLCSPLFREDFQFDECFFRWVETTNQCWDNGHFAKRCVYPTSPI